jgi:Heterokaryon incompatibility protein (HET)
VPSHWSCAREVSPGVDYKLLLEWLDFCKKHHSNSCNAESLPRLESFMAIDCDSGELVSPPSGCAYAALSYVWGAVSNAEQIDHDISICTPGMKQRYFALDQRVPRVVQDAITVTKELGLKYLWIDKYCINQNDQSVKLEQIGKMDLIYGSAEFTIIAAAGSDENHGLPGVNSYIRKDLYGGDLRGLRRVSSQTRLYCTIRESKWSTRGWTYQEAMLSRRRILFTEAEVYFECCGMHCREAVRTSLSLFHRKDMKNFMSWIRPGFFAGAGGISTGWSKGLDAGGPFCERRQRQFVCHVENFSTRQLTHDSDSLLALLGILRTFESAVPPIYHIAGLPVVCGAAGTATRSFISALGWRHKTQYHFRSPKRRSSFPSWSWIGWESTAMFLKDDSSFNTFEIEVSVKDTGRNFLALETSGKINMSSQVRSPEISNIILLSAWVVRPTMWLEWKGCAIRNISRGSQNGFIIEFCISLPYISKRNYCWVQLSQGIEQINDVFEKLLDSRFSCIILGSAVSSTNLLLVEWQRSREFATRVGTVSMVGAEIADIQRWKLERRFIELR